MVLLASNYDQSRFLKAQDLPTEKKFRIKNVSEEEIGFGKDKQKKLVLWFTSTDRGLVLNKTNIRTLAGPFGDTCDSWVGKIIIVFPTMAEFRGEMKPALRVRIPPPKQATTAGHGQIDDGIPESLRRGPATKAKQPDPAEVDDDLNDEINF